MSMIILRVTETARQRPERQWDGEPGTPGQCDLIVHGRRVSQCG